MVERIFGSLEKTAVAVRCGKWFLQAVMPTFHNIIFPLCPKDRIVAKHYKNFLGNAGPIGVPYLSQFAVDNPPAKKPLSYRLL